jgi:hypothetical protein
VSPTQHAAAAAVLLVRQHDGIGGVSTDERHSSAGPAPLSLALPRGAQTCSNLSGENHRDLPTQPGVGAAAGTMAPRRILGGVVTDEMASSESAPAPERRESQTLDRRPLHSPDTRIRK